MMIRIFAMMVGSLFILGCQSNKNYTTQQDYVEEYKWDREKGFVKNFKGSWTVDWKD